MPRRLYPSVKAAFEEETVPLPIADIRPLKLVSAIIKKTSKYNQIVASIGQVGIIEPPVVARDRSEKGKYLLLDGHLRLEALKDQGATQVVCLIAVDDEAFTYNKRVNRIAIIQEHRMIIKAIDRGVSEERIARSLNVDVASIRRKRRLLEGICEEASELLKDKHVAISAFSELRKLSPLRQLEAAELMVAMNRYTISYVRSLVAATPQAQMADTFKPKVVKGLSEEQIALMEREAGNLEREFHLAEQSYGTDHLDLVLANGYIGKLLENARILRYLASHHRELLAELQKLVDVQPAAA